jgi:hypothetical protein
MEISNIHPARHRSPTPADSAAPKQTKELHWFSEGAGGAAGGAATASALGADTIPIETLFRQVGVHDGSIQNQTT